MPRYVRCNFRASVTIINYKNYDWMLILCWSLERRSIWSIIDLGSPWAYSKIFFVIQVHENIVKWRPRLHSNIGKIICKNINNIFQIQNSGNFKTDFFKTYICDLWVFFVKQVSFKNYSFYELSLWHLYWFSGLDSAPNLHNFCVVV